MRRLAIVGLISAACSHPSSQVMPDAGGDAAVTPDTIAFTVTPKRLVANGLVKARLTITLTGGDGSPLAGRQVTITSDVPAMIEPATATTDATGVMTAKLQSTNIGVVHLTATADDLGATATITLTDPCGAPRLPANPGVALGNTTAGDFNGDGVLDLVGTTPMGFGFASGNADGSFQPVELVSNVSSGFGVVAGDFDRDGNLDLAGNTYGATSGDAVIILGNGDGTFRQPALIPIGASLGPIVSGDFDGDGMLDLAMTGAASGTPPIGVMYGNGDGTFDVHLISSGESANNTMVMIAADLNGDHRTDLVSSDYYSPFVTVHFGNANRTFDPGVNVGLDGSSGVGAMTAADLDHDGNLDLAIARYYPSSTTVLINNGSGGFAAPHDLAGATQGASIIAMDVDHDTHLDLIASDGAALYVSLGDGAGNFGAPARHVAAAGALSSADFNNDGMPDLVLGGGPTVVLLAEATGLSIPDLLIAPVNSIAVADFDHDGHLDLATIPLSSDTTSYSLQILHGAGNGTFTPVASYPIGSIWQSTGTIITADLDGIHGPDLVIVGVLQVTVLINDGSGGFSSSTLFAQGQGARHRGLAVADFDHDGKLDIAVSNEGWAASTATLQMAYGNGDGTFQTPVEFDLPAGTFWLVAADLDGDAYPDLVSHGQSPVSVLRGGPHGSFGPPAIVLNGGGLLNGGVVVADMDHDGHADILSSSIDLGIMRGHGDGMFDPAVTIASWEVGNPQLAVDLDGDGALDIIAGDYGDVSVLLGHPDGTFDDPLHYPSSVIYNFEHVIAADIDGNGLLDLVTPAGILLQHACTR